MANGHQQVGPDWSGARPPVSVVILTLNEEANIRACIDSCSWSDDVQVLDSGSEDATAKIARELGAGVHVHPFESFGRQRNWAIDNISLKHDWVFHLDADERFTPELVEEMNRVIRAGPDDAGFHVPNKLMFMGRWLRRAGGYPTYQMRLFHKERMRFKDHGHGQREDTEGKVGVLENPYLHYSFSKGLYDWFDKHNRYSSLEALQMMASRTGRFEPRALFSADQIARRRAWKEVTYRMPFWPTLRWLYTLLILGAVFEGRAGRTYARLLKMYDQMIAVKLSVLKAAQRRRGREVEREIVPRPSVRVFEAGDRIEPGMADGRLGARAGAQDGEDADVRTDETGQLVPEASPWTFREKVLRAIWMLVGKPLFRISFHNWYGYRAWLLRMFGAKVGRGVRLRPTVNIEIPWNIELRDGAVVGDHAILYSLGKIAVGERTIISQYAHLCAGTHDHTDRRFPLIRDPIEIGADAWIGADAYVGPNVRIGRLSVLGARASAYKDLDKATVYIGNPAKALKKRELR